MRAQAPGAGEQQEATRPPSCEGLQGIQSQFPGLALSCTGCVALRQSHTLSEPVSLMHNMGTTVFPIYVYQAGPEMTSFETLRTPSLLPEQAKNGNAGDTDGSLWWPCILPDPKMMSGCELELRCLCYHLPGRSQETVLRKGPRKRS